MKIAKFGHCCLLVEEKNLRILTDPGAWTTAQNEVRNLDVVLITHEHPDHLHIESVKSILANNPKVQIFTVRGVGKILEKEGIAFNLLGHLQNTKVSDVSIEGFGEKHADIYPAPQRGYSLSVSSRDSAKSRITRKFEQSPLARDGSKTLSSFGVGVYPGVPVVDNTGYFIAQRFFYPGDAFFNSGKSVEILALPVAGPWMKIAEAIDYAKEIKPKVAFPVHDGMLKILGPFHLHPKRFLEAVGIKFIVPEEGKAMEF